MHDNYCCHRDLKPNNILCLENGKSIKIADFNVILIIYFMIRFQNLVKVTKNLVILMNMVKLKCGLIQVLLLFLLQKYLVGHYIMNK